MKIVLKRDIKNVGKVGDIVAVKDGYGRNFLLPKGYAVVATKNNIEKLQEKINELKKQNEILIEKSKIVADLLSKQVFNVVKQVADDDTMYGSIRTKDIYLFICDLLKKNNIDFSFDIGSIKVSEPIKMLGKYLINIELFSGVDGILRLNICRAIADFEDDVNEFDKKREKSLSLSKELKNSGDLKQDKSFLNQKKEKSDIKEDISDDGDKKDLKDEAK